MRSKFPAAPGVYLFQDQAGRVLYVGKAKNLRARAGSYFLAAAASDQRTIQLVREAYDIDFIEAESEVDALLMEARLIKDIQPKFNRDLRDDKTFPYLQITTHEDFPRVEVTREPRTERRETLRAVYQCRQPARGDAGSAAGVQVSHLLARHRGRRRAVAVVSAVSAGVDQPVHGAVQLADFEGGVSQGHPTAEDVLGGQSQATLRRDAGRDASRVEGAEVREGGPAARRDRHAREPPRAGRDQEARAAGGVLHRSEEGARGLQKILKLDEKPRNIEGVDIAHLGGNETVASLVQFLDGLPFKPGYRRFRIRDVEGIDDYASIREVVARRFRKLRDDGDVFPDILLIDGGIGQLRKGLEAFELLGIKPPTVLSLAKQEELLYVPGRDEPLRLSRRSYALRLLQYVRDEAHRFAQHYHHLLRRKRQIGE